MPPAARAWLPARWRCSWTRRRCPSEQRLAGLSMETVCQSAVACGISVHCPSRPMCRPADAPRSLLGLPILSCRSPHYLRWTLLILLVT